MALTLTEKAAQEVKKVITEQANGSDQPMYLRMRAIAGGCSGFQYGLELSNSTNPEADEVFEQHGVKVVVDKRSLMLLDGTTVDYYEGLDKRGFSFNNPNAVKSCGCGSSFQV